MDRMHRALLVAVVALALVAGAQETLAETALELRVFVQASIGISIDAPTSVTIDLGKHDGFFMKIINEGNIRDRIRVVGDLDPPTDWVHFSFTCIGTLGECDSVQSSKPHAVDNVELTPEINETTVYVDIVGWRDTRTLASPPLLRLNGFSLTNATVQKLKDITINIHDSSSTYGPLAAPEMNVYAMFLLFITVAFVAYRYDEL